MFICNDQKFVFIHVPKCAGSSVHIFFKDMYWPEYSPERADPLPLKHHMTYEQCIKENPEVENYFSFTFVRNPWNRVVSSFNDFWIRERWNKETPKPFDVFVKERLPEILSNQPEDHTIHYFPASYFIEGVEFIGKVENFNEDWNSVMDTLLFEPDGWYRAIGRHRTSPRKKDYREYYDSDTKEIVKQLYAEDIERFNYEY